jgi:hypothetical protein
MRLLIIQGMEGKRHALSVYDDPVGGGDHAYISFFVARTVSASCKTPHFFIIAMPRFNSTLFGESHTLR